MYSKNHTKLMNASDIIERKKEKNFKAYLESLSKNNKNSNNIKIINKNKIASVSNYNLYLQLSKPKHSSILGNNITTGYNTYRQNTAVGSISDINLDNTETTGVCTDTCTDDNQGVEIQAVESASNADDNQGVEIQAVESASYADDNQGGEILTIGITTTSESPVSTEAPDLRETA